MSIEIETGRTFPTVTKKARYPFAKLKVGESFVVPYKSGDFGSRVNYWNRKFKAKKGDGAGQDVREFKVTNFEDDGITRIVSDAELGSRVFRIK